MIELRRKRCLIAAVVEVPGVAEEHVFVRVRHFEGVHSRVRDHRAQGPDDRPVDVVLLLGTRRCPIGVRELIGLRRRLSQPADRPCVVRADLMVHAHHVIPHVVMREIGEVELGSRRDVDGAAAILIDPLEIREVMELVLDDGPSEPAAPLHLARVRLRQVLLLGEEVAHGHRLVLIEKERGAVQFVRALPGDGVDDAA